MWTAPEKKDSNRKKGTANRKKGTVRRRWFLPISPRKTAFSYMRARPINKKKQVKKRARGTGRRRPSVDNRVCRAPDQQPPKGGRDRTPQGRGFAPPSFGGSPGLRPAHKVPPNSRLTRDKGMQAQRCKPGTVLPDTWPLPSLYWISIFGSSSAGTASRSANWWTAYRRPVFWTQCSSSMCFTGPM